MAKTRDQKSAELSSLAAILKGATSIVFSNYRGMKVKDITLLRRDLRKEKVALKVAKKTLYAIAAKEAGLPEVPKHLMEGPVAIAVSKDDPLAPARLLHTFAKDHKELQLLGGIFEGQLMHKADVTALALIPGREALLGQLVSVMSGPMRGLVSVLHETVAKFVRTVSEISKQQTAQPSA